ncbi:hypothetical protein EON65_50515 [archaeon]|nr:MAG: hypothetical protein EON65_50515 [archaeon]
MRLAFVVWLTLQPQGLSYQQVWHFHKATPSPLHSVTSSVELPLPPNLPSPDKNYTCWTLSFSI